MKFLEMKFKKKNDLNKIVIKTEVVSNILQ